MKHLRVAAMSSAMLVLVACRNAPRDAAASEAPRPPSGEAWFTPEQMQRAHIEIANVSMSPTSQALVASGRVTFDDARVAHVYAPVNGRVTRIDAALGQHVAKGAALATIQSPDIGAVSSDLRKADADLLAAEHDYTRQKELHDAHAASAADFEKAEDVFAQAKAEQARSRQKAALLRTGSADAVSQTFTLLSPIAGEVIARNINPGLEVQGQYGGGSAAELFTVGELDRIWVFADIYESDVARVAPNMKVAVSAVSFPSKSYEGVVDWVGGTLDPVSRMMRIRCVLENPERLLKPEMYATVRVAVPEHASLSVPRTAVVHLGDYDFVFASTGTTGDGRVKFQRIPVTLDDTEGARLDVVRGLALDTPIAILGADVVAAAM
jgi:cobalt-zinc-cadmium efflux system membrane fusion protein